MADRERRKASVNFCLLAAIGLALAGCDPTQPYQAPGFPFAGHYGAGPRGSGQYAGAPVLLTNDSWWQRFRDPVLDGLVAQAFAGNLNLAIARERMVEAQATRRGFPGAASLTPDANSLAEGSNLNDAVQVSKAEVSLNWLLDPYGGRRAQVRAAEARLGAARAEVDAARLLVLFNLGNAYVDLRYEQRLLALRRQDLAMRQKTLALTQSLFDANSATKLDILKAEAHVAEIEASLPALLAAVQAGKNQIAVLVGVAPGSLAVDLDHGAAQPRPRLSPQVGIPADLVRNRPDIRIAERQYEAAVADTGAAHADLYPRLSLVGQIALTSVNGRAVTNNSYFGPSVSFPALLSPAPRAAVDIRASVARQAHEGWQATVLQALQQVEESLGSYRAASAAVAGSEKTARLYGQVVTLTDALIARDGATLRDRMDAESAITAANATLASSLHDLGRSFVALNVNLGSGSADAAAVPAAPAN